MAAPRWKQIDPLRRPIDKLNNVSEGKEVKVSLSFCGRSLTDINQHLDTVTLRIYVPSL